MKKILYISLLMLALTIPAPAQSDWDTYRVRAIADIVKAHSEAAGRKSDIVISADPFPSKTKAVYTGQHRPIGQRTKDFIKFWVETRNLPAGNADMLIEEGLFREQDREYWIPVLKKIVPFVDKELKAGDEIIIYYFFLGGYNEAQLIQKDKSLSKKDRNQEAAKAKDEIKWIFAVEEFQKAVAKAEGSASGTKY